MSCSLKAIPGALPFQGTCDDYAAVRGFGVYPNPRVQVVERIAHPLSAGSFMPTGQSLGGIAALGAVALLAVLVLR